MKGDRSTLGWLRMTSLPVLLVASAVVLLGVLALLLNATPSLGM